MRIAIFVNGYLPISETFILRQIVGLVERGHRVNIFAVEPLDPTKVHPEALRQDLTARVRYLRAPRSLLWRMLNALWLVAWMGWRGPVAVVKALNVFRYGRAAWSLNLLYATLCLLGAGRRYDIVHCQFGSLGPAALRLIQVGALSGKLVTSFRGYDAAVHLKDHPGSYERLFAEGDLFCPVSQSLKKLIMDAGCREEKIVVLASGVDCVRLTYGPRTRAPDEPVRLLTIARLVEKKGVAFALRAVAKLVRQGRRVSYTIAGDGVLRPELERLIEELGLGAHVRILGWVNEEQVARLLQEAHILLAPSVTSGDGDQEGIPNVVKEAMATGLPLVTTRHGGIPELVEEGVSGFLVAERDADALADRLAHLIGHPELWAAMGRAGRMRVEREFDVERLNDRWIELYQHLLRNGAAIGVEDESLAVVR